MRLPGSLLVLVGLAAFMAVGAPALAEQAPSADAPVLRWYGDDLVERWSTVLAPAAPAAATAATGRPLLASPWRQTLEPVDLSGFLGETIPLVDRSAPASLIDVWASWCAPCRAELPHFQGLWETYRDRGLHAVAANLGEPAEDAVPFAREFGLTMPVARMPEELAAELGIEGLPVLILADGRGRILHRWNNYLDGMEDAVAQAVDRAMRGEDAAEEEIARIDPGGAPLVARWSRVAPDAVQGVAFLPPRVEGEGPRLAVVVQRTLLTVAADGRVLRRLGLGPAAGQLRALVRGATGDPFLIGFREAGSRLFFVDWSERAHDRWDAGAPVFDVELRERPATPAATEPSGEAEALLATTAGLLRWNPGEPEPRAVEGLATVSAIERAGGGDADGWIALEPGGRLLRLDGSLAPRAEREAPAGAWRLAAHPSAPGFAVAGESVAAVAGGSMLAAAELAIAGRDGDLWIVDVADGRVLHRSVWPAPVLPGYRDLDGDGRDELVAVVGNRLTVLEPAPGSASGPASGSAHERPTKAAGSTEIEARPGAPAAAEAASDPANVQKRQE